MTAAITNPAVYPTLGMAVLLAASAVAAPLWVRSKEKNR